MSENQRAVRPPVHGRRSVSQQWLTQVVTDQLARHLSERNQKRSDQAGSEQTGPSGSAREDSLTVVDLGGGTGGLAAALAAAGHQVLVVDPSPDALAATARRAAEMNLTDRLSGVQGDTTTLSEVVEPGSVDVVLCHLVLRKQSETAQALQSIAPVLTEGGLLSVVVPQRYQQVLRQAMNGNISAAQALLADTEMVDRRSLHTMLQQQGWQVLAEHGIGVVADQVSEAAVEGQYDQLLQLEAQMSRLPEQLEAAGRLHLLATR